jgi:iron-regulated transporter 1
MLSMERDWVVAVASPDGKPYDLTHLNSTMRRIDLICKLIAPIMISLIISATSVKTSILVTGFMSFASWAAEVWCAKRVYNASAKLRAPKLIEQDQMSDALPAHGIRPSFQHQVSQTFHRYTRDFQNYFSSTVWIPSMSLTLLHLSALSYGATFVTFLLSAGISLEIITMARAAGSVVEISSTVVTPVGVRILGKASRHGRYRGRYGVDDESASTLMNTVNIEEESRTETGLERLGLWGLSWQLLNLVCSSFHFLHSMNDLIWT